jgi:hypothetical protein
MVNITWTPAERKFIGLQLATLNTPFTKLPKVAPHCYETLLMRTRQTAYKTACKNWQHLHCQGYLSAAPSRQLQTIYSNTLRSFDEHIQNETFQLLEHRHMTIRRFLQSIADELTQKVYLSLLQFEFHKETHQAVDLPLPDLSSTDFIHFYCYLSNKERCFIQWSDPPKFTLEYPTAPICFERQFI